MKKGQWTKMGKGIACRKDGFYLVMKDGKMMATNNIFCASLLASGVIVANDNKNFVSLNNFSKNA